MKELGSRQELELRREGDERETDDRVDRTKEHQEEVDSAAEAWNRQVLPALSDTAESLRRIADQLDARVHEEAERHESEVNESVEVERTDVSEPSRDGEASEREASHALEADSHGSGRYVGELLDAAEQRNEAAEFLEEIAEGNEAHQHESREETERLNDEARRRAEALHRF